jgi:hypothetical protein
LSGAARNLLHAALLALPAIAVGQDYPSFIGSATPTPTPPPIELAESLPLTEFGQVLAGDALSTQTWTLVRARVEPALEAVRVQILLAATDEEMTQAESTVEEALAAVEKLAPAYAPSQQQALRSLANRILRLVSLMLSDSRAGESARVSTSDRLLRRATEEWNQLLARSDAERGLPPEYLVLPPRGWNVGYFELPDFRGRIMGWSIDQLIVEYRSRLLTIEESFHPKRRCEEVSLTGVREMGELARELASRTWEFPHNSREPFRNSALRLDVMAENLHDYLREDNALYAKRQLRTIDRAMRETEAFLTLRQPTAK